MEWNVNTALPQPPSAQLVERALDLLSSGRLGAGDKLPSVRALAAEARVNANTAARAWRELEHLGVAKGENGRGVFVTPEGPTIAAELRLEATARALEETLAAALRAGHSPEDLAARVECLLDNKAGPGSFPSDLTTDRKAG